MPYFELYLLQIVDFNLKSARIVAEQEGLRSEINNVAVIAQSAMFGINFWRNRLKNRLNASIVVTCVIWLYVTDSACDIILANDLLHLQNSFSNILSRMSSLNAFHSNQDSFTTQF